MHMGHNCEFKGRDTSATAGAAYIYSDRILLKHLDVTDFYFSYLALKPP